MRILIAIICAQSMLTSAYAGPVVYSVDSSRSEVTLSGTSDGQPFQTQQNGSLTTRFWGTISADKTSSQIQITAATLLAANTGSYVPAAGSYNGSAPANYGLTVFVSDIGLQAMGAVRGLRANAASPTMVITNSRFPSNEITLNFTAGAFDLTLGFPGTGMTLPIDQQPFNNTAAPGTIAVAGLRETITIPILASQTDAPPGGDVTQFIYTGQLVASRWTLKKFILAWPFELFLLDLPDRITDIIPMTSESYANF